MSHAQVLQQEPRAARRGKVRAVLAGCAALGVGAAVTLAAWTDTEWVFGGCEGDGVPIGTSVFEVQQNVFDGAGFTDRETAPGGQLRFSPNAAGLTPGDRITAPMQLRTTTTSDGAAVTLQPALLNGSNAGLFAALTYGAYTGLTQAQCEAGMLGGAGILVAAGSPLATGSIPAAIVLQPDQGNTVDICFVITLPTGAPDALQGTAAAPAWEFTAASTADALVP